MAGPFIAFGLLLVTLPHHWRARNLSTLSIIAWLSLYNVTYGVNAVIWSDNTDTSAATSIWCDIATKIKIGADVGLPGCSLCMARRLNRIAYGLDMNPRGWMYRALDIFLCWGLPFLIMGMHVIVQGHRFDIIQDLGCIPAVYVSWPSIFILDLSALIPAVLGLIYCSLALIRLYRRRIAFRRMLAVAADESRTLTLPRYYRLMAMTFFLGAWNTALVSLSTVNEFTGGTGGLEPWTSWGAVHADFGYIGQFPLDKIETGALFCAFFLWWAVPFSGLAFFLFFGVGPEAMKDYRLNAAWVGRVVFRRASPSPPEPPSTPSDATFVDSFTTDGEKLSRFPTPALVWEAPV
ncbi:GPCR fungal pheromone mating factor [Roridomyces roridus]|uniref:GPCR fungal pheromone mating factor n=1 Tax=Roridomyces roridus TaxID=1738132 RepID=A0AAD7BS89_9AGAR|nr:GPCR fungal pheromone mating factor [Roridomyces roridus]